MYSGWTENGTFHWKCIASKFMLAPPHQHFRGMQKIFQAHMGGGRQQQGWKMLEKDRGLVPYFYRWTRGCICGVSILGRGKWATEHERFGFWTNDCWAVSYWVIVFVSYCLCTKKKHLKGWCYIEWNKITCCMFWRSLKLSICSPSHLTQSCKPPRSG